MQNSPPRTPPGTQPANSGALSGAHFQQFLTLLWRIFFCKTTNTKEILLSEGLRGRQVQNVGFERFKERLKTLVKSRTKMLRAEAAGSLERRNGLARARRAPAGGRRRPSPPGRHTRGATSAPTVILHF